MGLISYFMCQILLNITISWNTKYKQIVPNCQKVSTLGLTYFMLVIFIIDLCKVKDTCPLIKKWHRPKKIKQPLRQLRRESEPQEADTLGIFTVTQLSGWAFLKIVATLNLGDYSLKLGDFSLKLGDFPALFLLTRFFWNLFQHSHLIWVFEILWPSPGQCTNASDSITYFPLILQNLTVGLLNERNVTF